MSELNNWQTVIPNVEEGDIITPFRERFERQKSYDYIIDGGIKHNHYLEECVSVKRKSGKVGVYDSTGKQVLPEEFDECVPLIWYNGDFYIVAIKVKINELYGVYNTDGKMLVPVKFSDVQMRDKFFIVTNNEGLYGAYFLDKKIADCEYSILETHSSFDIGLSYIMLEKNGLRGIVLETGENIIPIKFSDIRKTNNGFVVYQKPSKKEWRIDKWLKGWYSDDGVCSVPCIFSNIKFSYDVMYVKTSAGLTGIYSYSGKEIVPAKYEFLESTGGGFYGEEEDGSVSLYTSDGYLLYHSKD